MYEVQIVLRNVTQCSHMNIVHVHCSLSGLKITSQRPQRSNCSGALCFCCGGPLQSSHFPQTEQKRKIAVVCPFETEIQVVVYMKLCTLYLLCRNKTIGKIRRETDFCVLSPAVTKYKKICTYFPVSKNFTFGSWVKVQGFARTSKLLKYGVNYNSKLHHLRVVN